TFPRRECARVSALTWPPRRKRAQGIPGASAAPIASHGKLRNHASFGHYRSANSPAFPAQWFDGLLRALPGVHDLASHRRLRIIFRKLNASPGAPGPHAFAARIDIARLTMQSVHRIPAPRVVTIAIRPSCRGEMSAMGHTFPNNGRRIIF